MSNPSETPSRIEVRRFDAARRADFDRVHCAEGGMDWCQCVAWWVPSWDGWGERSAEQNRALRDELCARGEYDGYLLYAAGRPFAWCQVGPRDRLQKLVQQFQLEPDPNTWAITCFQVAPAQRGKRLATRLLSEVLSDLRVRGVGRVEAFPKRGVGLEAGELWNGPEDLFMRAGFVVVRDDPVRPVLALER